MLVFTTEKHFSKHKVLETKHTNLSLKIIGATKLNCNNGKGANAFAVDSNSTTDKLTKTY